MRCPSEGLDIDNVKVDMYNWDEVSHRFLSDDLTILKSSALCPKTRILHRAIIQSLQPHTGSYKKVYERDFHALYAIYSSQRVNWTNIIFEEFLTVNHKRNYKTIHYGAYIMHILQNFGVPLPDAGYTIIGELNMKSLSLMGVPKCPESQQIISFQQWAANRDQGIPKPRDTNVASSSSQPPTKKKKTTIRFMSSMVTLHQRKHLLLSLAIKVSLGDVWLPSRKMWPKQIKSQTPLKVS